LTIFQFLIERAQRIGLRPFFLFTFAGKRHMRSYPAKLLLFGEHILLVGAPALAVPVPAFSGRWGWSEEMIGKQKRLVEFAHSTALAAVQGLDVEQFKRDLDQGLILESNIPNGYGLGSSGALCAAIYDRYCPEKARELNILKVELARMESFFHGNSSGIDPLTSYLAAPVLIEHKTEVKVAVFPTWLKPPIVFLLDSQLPRRTGPLVEWFLEQSGDAVFFEKLKTELLPQHEAMLQGWLAADPEKFWLALRHVSRFQFEQMPPMIPATVREVWQQSFEHQNFTLKTCGAGGGGYVLGFAKNQTAIELLKRQFEVVLPF